MFDQRFDEPRSLALAAGLAVATFAAAVLAAWAVHFLPLLQISPSSAPLTRQGAQAELLLGTALVCLAAGARRATVVLATVVLILALLVGFEYALDRDLGIDQIFGKDYVSRSTSPPGRISPAAALCYFSAALALVALASRKMARYAAAIAGIVASILIAMGGVMILSHALGQDFVYAWGHFRPISPQASAVVVFLGVGIMALALEESRMRQTMPRWLPTGLTLGLSAAALGVWQALIVHMEGQLPMLSHIILAGGIASALLIGIAVSQAQKAWFRSRELEEGKAAFERLFDASADALLVVDHVGRIVRANQRIQQFFGYKPHEVVGKRIESLVPIDLATLHPVHREDYFEHPETRGMAAGLDVHGRRKDGSEFPADISLSPLQSGGELEVLASVRDITERKQAEEALRQSEERFRRIFEDSPLGLVLVAPDLRLTKSNESFRRMLGYSDAELEFLTPPDITHPGDRDESRKLSEALFAGKIPLFKIEKRYLKKNGEIIWTTSAATAIRDREGRVLYTLGIIEDITERKRQQEALRESEERFRGVFETSPLGLALTRPDHSIAKVNASLCRMSGYSEAELLAMSLLERTHPEDREESERMSQRLFKGEIPFYQLEKRYIKKNDEIIWANQTVSILRDREGRPAYALRIIEDITERKRQQEALRESEELFRGLVEQSPVGVTIVGMDYRLIKVNPAFSRMLGYSEADLTRMTVLDLTLPEDRPLSVNLAKSLFSEGALSQRIEKRYITKSGQIIWARINASAIHDSQGKPIYGMGIIEDITDRKRAEEALLESEERFRKLFETSPLGMGLITPDYRLAKVNSSLCRMSGYSEAELLTMNPLDYTHPDDREESAAMSQRVFRGEIPFYQMEKRYIRKGGEVFWVTLTVSLLRGGEGRPTYVLGMAEDITERKHAEQQLAEQAALLDLAHDAIIVCDLNGTIRMWSCGAKDTYGWSADEAVGRITHELLQTEFPVDYQEVLAIFLAKGGWEGELVHKTREGKKLIMASRWSLQRDETGAPHSILEINRDITARKRLEEQVETGREQAAAAARLSALGMMAGGVAHEINNPLAIIHALASDMMEQVDEHGTVPPEVVARSSRRIVETTERIAHIVKSLRKISREGTKDRYYPVRIGKILEETLEITRARFEARGVKLILPGSMPDVTVSAREVQIEQVVLNLLQNAFDAVVDQDGEPWVRVDVTSREGAAVVSVIDSGPGIPPDLRDYIGQPFFTTKEVGKGAGLGLSLSRTIAEEHGGRIEYDEDSGHTRFSLVLPLARQAEAA